MSEEEFEAISYDSLIYNNHLVLFLDFEGEHPFDDKSLYNNDVVLSGPLFKEG